MAAITATNSTTPSLVATLGRAKLAQAEREASQAESNARQLRAQADQAEQQAQQSEANVTKVAAESRRDLITYSISTRTPPKEVPIKVQNFIENLYRATSKKRAESGNSLKESEDVPPVINAQGQSTGRILNLSA